jgi:hypothetical protein
MNRRSLIAAIPLLSFAPPVQAQPTVAEVVYGPQPITSPSGETFWMLATTSGAFAIPEYETLRAVFPDDVAFAKAVRACGEWVLFDGRPSKWSHAEMRWVPLL